MAVDYLNYFLIDLDWSSLLHCVLFSTLKLKLNKYLIRSPLFVDDDPWNGQSLCRPLAFSRRMQLWQSIRPAAAKQYI